MMPGLDYRLMFGLGLVLVLLGALFPWLMVLGYLRSSFALNILSFAASLVGLMLGIASTAFWVSVRRRKK